MNKMPKVIVHNSISLNGSLTNFPVNMELHYRIASNYKPQVHLIGSNTIKIGAKSYGPTPKETRNDFIKPSRNANLPYWIIIDTKGSLKGLLHTCRRFELCREVIVLISEKTPKSYINYLEKRNYTYHILGKIKVDLKKTIEFLAKKYNAKKIMTDTGAILSNLLINQGLVDEISLLIHPIIVNKSYNIFANISKDIKLELIKKETLEKNYIHLIYKIKK